MSQRRIAIAIVFFIYGVILQGKAKFFVVVMRKEENQFINGQ